MANGRHVAEMEDLHLEIEKETGMSTGGGTIERECWSMMSDQERHEREVGVEAQLEKEIIEREVVIGIVMTVGMGTDDDDWNETWG